MRLVVLTGAGISAESGVPTFRATDGLWENHRVEDVATPEGFAADPELVHRFYDARRRHVRTVEPNAAHRALARLEEVLGDDMVVVTQNIDDLHERAGSRNVIHMHGELMSAWCTLCGDRTRWSHDLLHRPPCPSCEASSLRPDVVWFGEYPYQLEAIYDALRGCDVFAAIGTSGVVRPAAGFARSVRILGARCVELNLESTPESDMFHERHEGPATEVVPAWVQRLIDGPPRDS